MNNLRNFLCLHQRKLEGFCMAQFIVCFDAADILKIDNLWCFTSLVKLQFDNNIIEKIEGLDILVNLIWLG